METICEEIHEKSFKILINTLKSIVEVMVLNNINLNIDSVNTIINSLFDQFEVGGMNGRRDFLKNVFVFLMFYTEFINKNLEFETIKIYEYIKSNGSTCYKINYQILDSVYVIIASLIEADLRKKDSSLIKSFDYVLTRNINKLQNDERIDFNPYKTPVISDILSIIIPIFDGVNFVNSYHNEK